MDKTEFKKVIDFIQGYYNRTLSEAELKALKEELKYYKNYDDFAEKSRFSLLKKVEYFTVAKLHQVIQEDKELKELKDSLGIKCFDEIYDN